ncbi:unnamed protein product [Coffea canephora]|uniref:Uncharacterized protein n=1 Tax=Coffea canephora TaxID=49390 RepID=A0A068VCB2_COFCA|nr:unnamed protein product [Coffea canephora]
MISEALLDNLNNLQFSPLTFKYLYCGPQAFTQFHHHLVTTSRQVMTFGGLLRFLYVGKSASSSSGYTAIWISSAPA